MIIKQRIMIISRRKGYRLLFQPLCSFGSESRNFLRICVITMIFKSSAVCSLFPMTIKQGLQLSYNINKRFKCTSRVVYKIRVIFDIKIYRTGPTPDSL
jgi:hypothetical protein